MAAAARILPADAAVGLLSRERSTLRGTLGGCGGGGTLRTLASEAAVGANRPVVGKGGREAVTPKTLPAAVAAAFFDDGVFGREPGVADSVGGLAAILAAVERESDNGALRTFDGVRGVGVLERAARAAAVVAVAVDGLVPEEDVDFGGDPGVLASLEGAVDGRDEEADARGLIAGVAAGIGAGAGIGTGAASGAGAMMGPSASAVDETVLGATEDPDEGATDEDSRSGRAPSSDAGVTNMVVEPRNVAADEGGLKLDLVPLALPFVLTGGHSRAMCCSSFTASPALFEVALVARDGGPDEVGWRFCCCSKRPMRFATD